MLFFFTGLITTTARKLDREQQPEHLLEVKKIERKKVCCIVYTFHAVVIIIYLVSPPVTAQSEHKECRGHPCHALKALQIMMNCHSFGLAGFEGSPEGLGGFS